MSFKIIAIRPLKKCKDTFLKVLQPDTFYYFYNEYNIEHNSINYTPTSPENLFYGKIPINICAVVGKNGSGKSSLIELLIIAINNLSIQFEIRTNVQLVPVEGLHIELYFFSDAYYKIVIEDNLIRTYEQPITSSQFVELPNNSIELRKFFYTIIVNYSHYSLNKKEMGPWIESLFHKNDGYQTPIVLNPMRDDGDIDINNETYLSKSRLIANLLRPDSSLIRITDNLKVNKLALSYRPGDASVTFYIRNPQNPNSTLKQFLFSDLDESKFNDILHAVNHQYPFEFEGRWESGNIPKNYAHYYILRKLIKIAITYPAYIKYFDSEKLELRPELLSEYLSLLLGENQNHIAFKLKQVLNFLKYPDLYLKFTNSFELPIDDLAKDIDKIINKEGLTKESTIEFVPPPIFNVDIIMDPIDQSQKKVFFSTLSSGEKQLLYSVNSILYHLINLDSINDSPLQKGYQKIQLILEEIELYFHPDLQRRFIYYLLNCINELNFKNILQLNICLITHSPFILSDIPNTNILFINEKGNPKTQSEVKKTITFGANIHDLLADSFFLEESFMGKWAQQEIEKTIRFLNYQYQIKHKQHESSKSKDEKVNILPQDINPDRAYHKQLISIIGEPIIKNKLLGMYNEIFEDGNDQNEIKKQIEALAEQAGIQIEFKQN